MVSIPAGVAEITPEWLTAALAAREHPVVVRSVEVQRFAEGMGIVGDLYRLMLRYDAGSHIGPKTLVAKIPSSIAPMRELARSYGLYRREVAFYREVAATVPLRTPRCFFAEYDPTTEQFAILMEDLAPAQPGDQFAGMALDEVRLAIESIAALHAQWWNRPELKAMEEMIQPIDQPPYAGIDARYQAAFPIVEVWLANRVSPATMRVAERLATRLDHLARQSGAPPRTICHGDFRAENLMFLREVDNLIMWAVDWQIAMQARGTFEIGYLLGGHVTREFRREHERELLALYHHNLVDGDVSRYDFDECFEDYRRSILTGFNYWVQGGAATDLSHPRIAALFEAWAQRLDAATNELGLAEFVT
jgi:hypothetical protein